MAKVLPGGEKIPDRRDEYRVKLSEAIKGLLHAGPSG